MVQTSYEPAVHEVCGNNSSMHVAEEWSKNQNEAEKMGIFLII